MSSTVLQNEIENFAKDSPQFWDENGPFKPLHALNPVRLGYLRDRICDHYGLDHTCFSPFKKLDMLDIGCGGGLVCEPFARLGGKVTGADADVNAITVAEDHAKAQGLKITYKACPAEELLKGKRRYDVVTALEIVEHVSDLNEFVSVCTQLLKPGGILIFSTLNRTPKSYMLGIVAAEHVLRWVPKGTHTWKKFVKPSELSRAIKAQNMRASDITGLIYNPLKDQFSLSKSDIAVNYFMAVKK
jgi:2-polyprenyl-6-hydroxyphenyl methylase/3-demethylubiquinone-9 3-methyltransferase